MENLKMIAKFLLAKSAEEYRLALLSAQEGDSSAQEQIDGLEEFFKSSYARRLAAVAGSNSSPANIIREFRRISADEIPSAFELLEKSLGIYSLN